jgi:hypothetical protein
VDFQPGLTGTITLTTGELAISKDLTIEGPGASVIAVSGNHARRVFNIANFTVTISGLTIADGEVIDDVGGGIYNAGTLTVSACTFSGNVVGAGGGIYNDGMLTVTASTFSGNSASSASGKSGGGGIYNKGTLTITASTFSGNSGGVGGGIINFGPLTITASTFSGNSAFNGGGIFNNHSTLTVTTSIFSGNSNGIYNNYSTLTITASTFSSNSNGITSNGGTVTVTASTFSGNSALYGGGIDNGGTLTITASTFSGNSAVYGGGIYNFSTLTVTDSTFSGNSASGNSAFPSGGGIENSGTLTVIASTFSGNSASVYGGGFHNYLGAKLMIRNTLLAGNSSRSGGPDVYGPLNSLGYNLIGDGSGSSGYTATDLVGTSASPIEPKLGPLQDDGGPTWTMALLTGSLAIGAGGPTDSEWDQRGPGYARSVNGMTDIGAYEAQPSGAGSAAFTLRFSEPPHIVPVLALGGPSAPSVPLRQADATVDRVFASWTSEAATLILGRSRHAALVEQGLWRFVPICGVTE